MRSVHADAQFPYGCRCCLLVFVQFFFFLFLFLFLLLFLVLVVSLDWTTIALLRPLSFPFRNNAGSEEDACPSRLRNHIFGNCRLFSRNKVVPPCAGSRRIEPDCRRGSTKVHSCQSLVGSTLVPFPPPQPRCRQRESSAQFAHLNSILSRLMCLCESFKRGTRRRSNIFCKIGNSNNNGSNNSDISSTSQTVPRSSWLGTPRNARAAIGMVGLHCCKKNQSCPCSSKRGGSEPDVQSRDNIIVHVSTKHRIGSSYAQFLGLRACFVTRLPLLSVCLHSPNTGSYRQSDGRGGCDGGRYRWHVFVSRL